MNHFTRFVIRLALFAVCLIVTITASITAAIVHTGVPMSDVIFWAIVGLIVCAAVMPQREKMHAFIELLKSRD